MEQYFSGISRMEPVTIRVPTDQKDRMGHTIYREEPAINDLGEEIQRRVYYVPPTLGGLCDHLGIYRKTWFTYALPDEDGKMTACGRVVEMAMDRMEAYLDEQLIVSKNVRGVQASLEKNFGTARRVAVDLVAREAQQGEKPVAEMSMAEKMELIRQAADGLEEML